jgi:hypothetical protein
MVVAVFVPASSVQRVGRLLARFDVRFAVSWREFESLLRKGAQVAVFDPTADSGSSISDVLGVWRRWPSVSYLAYVTRTPANLKAVFKLSTNWAAAGFRRR